MKSAMRALVLFGLSAALAACGASDGERKCGDGGDGNSLDGSYCEDIDMFFTSTRVRKLDSGGRITLTVEYLRTLSGTPEKTLQIIFDATDTPVVENQALNLVAASAAVRRVLADGIITLTEELEATSTITFSTYSGEFNSKVTGKLALLFSSGRTLTGEFDTTLVDARADLGE